MAAKCAHLFLPVCKFATVDSKHSILEDNRVACVLQDHFRSIVKPAYTNVYRERGGVLGVVEFDTREDLERAIRKLDDTEFKNPFDRAYIRVIDESDDRGRSRSRSPRGR